MLNQSEKDSLVALREHIANGQPYRISYPLALAYLNEVGHENFVKQNMSAIETPLSGRKLSKYLFPDDIIGFYASYRSEIIKDLEIYNSSFSNGSVVSHVHDMFTQKYDGLLGGHNSKASLDDMARIIFSDEKDHKYYEKTLTVIVSALVTNVSDYYRDILQKANKQLNIESARSEVFDQMISETMPDSMATDNFHLVKAILVSVDKDEFIQNINSHTGKLAYGKINGVTYPKNPLTLYQTHRKEIVEWLEYDALKNSKSSLDMLNAYFSHCGSPDDIHILAKVIYGQDTKHEFYDLIVKIVINLLAEQAAEKFKKHVDRKLAS